MDAILHCLPANSELLLFPCPRCNLSIQINLNLTYSSCWSELWFEWKTSDVLLFEDGPHMQGHLL